MAFTFLVKSRKDYENLLVELYKLQSKYYPFVGFEINSEYLQNTVKPEIHKDDLFEDIKWRANDYLAPYQALNELSILCLYFFPTSW